MVQDFVARLRNPTLVVLEWTPPQRPGIIKYRVRLLHCCASGNCSKRKALIIVDVIILFLFTVGIIHYYAGHISRKLVSIGLVSVHLSQFRVCLSLRT